MQGLSYRAIGKRLGVSQKTAHGYIAAELALCDTPPEERHHLRELERLRLENILRTWLPIAAGENVVVKTVVDGPNGPRTSTVPDYLVGTRAAEIVVKVSARIAALYGLDHPVQFERGGSAGLTPQALADAERELALL